MTTLCILQLYRNAGFRKTIMKVSLLVLLTLFSCTHQASYPPAPQNGQDIVIDASDLAPDTPTFYTYHYKDRRISYFVLKINDAVSSFLDACVSCSQHKQGYRYKDGAVTCRYCNMRFPVYKLEKGLGGCYPIKLKGRLENGKYRISIAELEAAIGIF
jgi:uncharacterized membrane protein